MYHRDPGSRARVHQCAAKFRTAHCHVLLESIPLLPGLTGSALVVQGGPSRGDLPALHRAGGRVQRRGPLPQLRLGPRGRSHVLHLSRSFCAPWSGWRVLLALPPPRCFLLSLCCCLLALLRSGFFGEPDVAELTSQFLSVCMAAGQAAALLRREGLRSLLRHGELLSVVLFAALCFWMLECVRAER